MIQIKETLRNLKKLELMIQINFMSPACNTFEYHTYNICQAGLVSNKLRNFWI